MWKVTFKCLFYVVSLKFSYHVTTCFFFYLTVCWLLLMSPGEVTTPAATKITTTAASAITDAPMEQQGSDSKVFFFVFFYYFYNPSLSFSFSGLCCFVSKWLNLLKMLHTVPANKSLLLKCSSSSYRPNEKSKQIFWEESKGWRTLSTQHVVKLKKQTSNECLNTSESHT